MRFFTGLRALFQKGKLDGEMAEEMQFHLKQRAAENVEDGFSPEEAAFAARRKFGGVDQIQEQVRDDRGWIWLEQVFRDIRFATRSLLRTPGFTAVAVLTLAIGIGATTTLFSVIDATLLHALPFPQPDQLMVVWETSAQQGVKREGPSGPDFYDWREQSRLFQDMAAVEIGTGTVTGLGDPQQIPAMRVTSNLFAVLNVRTAMGRLFVPEDGRGGRQARVIVSHDFWQHALHADPKIVGQSLMIDLISYQVVGVLAPDFALPIQSDLFVPWPDDELRFHRGRLAHDLGVFGRLRPDATSAQAEGELNAIAARLTKVHPELSGWNVTVVPLEKVAAEYLRPALIALFCAVVLVLFIACLNVANLLLARAIGRGREISVRAALGASRGMLVRQCLVESLVLGTGAGAVGVFLALWGVMIVSTILPHAVPIPDAAAEVTLRPFTIDARVLGFSVLVSILTSALFGIAPALHAFKTDLIDGLKKGGRNLTSGGRLREILLVGEVALALVLLAATAMTLQSFRNLEHADLGFRPDHLLTLEMELPTDSRYQTGREQGAFFSRVLEQANALPGVTRAAVTSILPLHNQDDRARFLIEGGPSLPPNEWLQADIRRISPEFFETMGIALKMGRALDLHDGDAKEPYVGVVDESFARQYFGGENPIGHTLLLDGTKLQIVGVVAAVKHVGADRDARPTLYVSFLKRPTARMNLVLRTAADPGTIADEAKAAIWKIDRDQPIYRVETMESVVAEATSAPRLTTSLLGVFATTALGLAALGIYGVMAYFVAQRSTEIGIHMALGARPAEVQRRVLRHGMKLTAFGLLLGLGGAWMAARLMANFLYGIASANPATLLGAALLLALVAFLSSWFPARRATKVDPLVALRAE